MFYYNIIQAFRVYINLIYRTAIKLHANCFVILTPREQKIAVWRLCFNFCNTFVRVHCFIIDWCLFLFIRRFFRTTDLEVSPTTKSKLQSSLWLSISFITHIYAVLPVVAGQWGKERFKYQFPRWCQKDSELSYTYTHF